MSVLLSFKATNEEEENLCLLEKEGMERLESGGGGGEG